MLRLIDWWMDVRGVARFARVMRRRLCSTRRAGRGGWWHPAWSPGPSWFGEQIGRNTFQGDYVDVGTFAMMAWHRIGRSKEPTSAAKRAKGLVRA